MQVSQPLISDYAFLSDCRSAALVSLEGSVDWLCWPRFDSGSWLGRILDRKAGHFSIRPKGPYRTSRRYLPGTLILVTRFETASGVVELQDWMHSGGRQALCRLATCLEGSVEVEVELRLRPDYSRKDPNLKWLSGYWMSGKKKPVFADGLSDHIQPQQGTLRDSLTLEAGQQHGWSLGFRRPGPSEVQASLKSTAEQWLDWSEDLQLPEQYQKHTLISALVLKGLQYKPSGAIVAAATTSLPESIGGQRNWDYRFSWLRDASFAVYALRAVGKLDEGQEFTDWIRNLALASEGKLQIMYGPDGEAELPEHELDHLEGYMQSSPVRIGNGAAGQRQLDVYGELLDCLWMQRNSSGVAMNRHRAMLVSSIADRVRVESRLTDEGIWEVRSGQRHFTYSKVMCWVALDRAVRLSQLDPHNFSQQKVAVWAEARSALKREILRRGYNSQMQCFTQSYGSKDLDAANLLLAQLGFVSRQDPRFVGTVEATLAHLTEDGLVRRYKLDSVPDGLQGEEAPFVICSFWLVSALHQIGKTEQAKQMFEKLLSLTNDLGLMSECVTAQGLQLGNTPQAFSHMALISCAHQLSQAP